MHGDLQRDESLVHEIEGVIKRKLGEYNCDEKAVFEDITQVKFFFFFSFRLIFILEGILLFLPISNAIFILHMFDLLIIELILDN